ncbi:unnamed protein product [Schistosoma curassoni]|uniref:RH1 domain-containing protein n=1 Tax=Schistosoma curassoni TaxID=6186 RepID=A0A183L4P3_9TREM|nr:unnamed protein product [Schistosoma curassoni]
MDFGKEQRISPRVYQLAQIIYREFEVIKKVYGESAYGGLVPIVVGILEEMDLLTVDKQKLDLDLNLLTAEKNDISVQLCRQKELYIAAKRHIHCLEDELLGMKKETDKKFEELEENSRHYQLLVKNANDHRRVYCAAVRSVLLNGCETWPLRVEDSRKLLVFDYRCLRNIAGICWDHRVSNNEVKRGILGNDGKLVDEVVNLHRLRWLGHVLRMPEHR